ncbi:MAG: hypothetical protein WC878_02480 [Candidatus Paceibacterota bacterium]|jgi:hypothetical protein
MKLKYFFRIVAILVFAIMASAYFSGYFYKEITPIVRENAVQSYVDNFQKFADTTNDEQARDNLQMLKDRLVIVTPSKTGFDYLANPQNDEKSVRTVALFDEDSRYPLWEKEMKNGAIATFLSSARLLILKNTPAMSDAYMGASLAHESEHIRRYFLDPVRVITDEIRAKEEVAVYTFQNELLAKAGGEKYTALLQNMVEKFASLIKISGNTASFPILPYNQSFDSMFGKALSSEEETYRAFLFQVDVMFHYYDMYQPQHAEGLKCDLINALYASWDE